MCGDVTSTTSGVVQSPKFPGDYGNGDSNCQVAITAPVGWMIQLKFTTFNVEIGKAIVGVRKRNRISAFDAAVKLVCLLRFTMLFILHSQVRDDLAPLMSYKTGNTIPALVPATINKMNIVCWCFASSKPSNAIYNWQATFSVTVNFISH
jgi:hypothetical protein